jgi:hypothetical protein
MKRQTVITQKKQKKRGPPATGKGTLVGVRIHPPMLAALDKWLDRQNEVRTRPDAIRFALADWLTSLGLLQHKEDPEGSN